MQETLWTLLGAGAVVGVALFWLAHYFRTRDIGFEDRYMELYGREEWDASNMELRISFAEEDDASMKAVFQERLGQLLVKSAQEPGPSLLHEEPQITPAAVTFPERADVSVDDLLRPRKGIFFDLTTAGLIRVVFNHLQADGVRVWRSIRPLFDPNPPIVEFDKQTLPPPLLPELLSLPTVVKGALLRSSLAPDREAPLQKGFQIWSTAPVKELKEQTRGKSFNLVSAAMLLSELFARHPEKDHLTAGMILAFPFLRSNNQYGVFSFRVDRGSFQEILRQVEQQVKHPVQLWGTFSVQTQLLSLLPDALFMKIMGFFRGQLDVLISNLPVGKEEITIGQTPCQISVYMDELSVPYYVLLVGTRSHLHLSYCSRFPQEEGFLCQESLLARLGEESLETTALPELPPAFPSITPAPRGFR